MALMAGMAPTGRMASPGSRVKTAARAVRGATAAAVAKARAAVMAATEATVVLAAAAVTAGTVAMRMGSAT
jgi:hypothetical protein